MALSLAAADSSAARTEVTLAGPDIPQRFFVGTGFIFHQSDSLFLNGRLLQRGLDYTFNGQRGAFDLTRVEVAESDTLLIVYQAVPSWLKSFYGTPPPEIRPGGQAPQANPVELRRAGPPPVSSDITVSGAKTFRFTTRSTGGSDFSQSLDLTLSGNLTPGLQLTGVVSDRGYDPSYGTANSRLNELDKINLSLTSRIFTAEVGDILVRPPGSAVASKRVSGAAVNLWQPQGYFNAAVARPKGRFESARFYGRDNTQGPYRVGQGSATTSVVPGSETIWLDGIKLERGANNDYTVDYPAGTITLNVNHPIDSRSRIEVDYEPLLTSYRGELLTSGGGVTIADSSISLDVQWLREGDDKDEPFAGELTAEEMDSLRTVGDRVTEAVRSGVTMDSLGSYVLAIDSLPDSVYQYVGEGSGDYSVTFSFSGPGRGDYVYLGGSQYRYAGKGEGDYLPLIVIPVPERLDHYFSTFHMRGLLLSEFTAQLQQTRYDRNLFSDLDDGDNDGLFYSVSSRKDWRQGDRENHISFQTRKKEARFKARQRLYDPDFSRNYFLPAGFQSATDELKHDLAGMLSLTERVSLTPAVSYLKYSDHFTSRTAGLGVDFKLSKRYRLSAGWNTIRAELDTLNTGRQGEADVYRFGATYRSENGFGVTSAYERDLRTNNYRGEKGGTRYDKIGSSVGNQTEQITYEYFGEDTLLGEWARQLERHRLSGSSSRRLGYLAYSTLATYQWLQVNEGDENSFLSRIGFDYNDPTQRLTWGASYTISEETRNGRGITYIEVEPGEGDYSFENGEFVPDPDGNFVRVEETLSETSRVRRGEKSFHFEKSWSQLLMRFNSNIEEELLPGGSRALWWVVPLLSDRKQPYLVYSRRYGADLRVFPIRSGHAINLNYNEDREIRAVADLPRRRDDFTGAITFRQVVQQAFFDERLELFKKDRDAYFSGAGKVDGYRISLDYRQGVLSGEVSAGIGLRRADSEAGERSVTYLATIGSRVQVLRKGELRSTLEGYRQFLEGVTGSPSFLLTDDRSGTRGAVWSISLRYGLKGDMRVNFGLSGRHADNQVARITGRGEFVAGF